MGMKIVTGTTGEPHITSDDDGALNMCIFGNSNYVLSTGEQFAYNLNSSTEIRIKSGNLIMNGRHARIQYGDYEDVAIDSGTQGVNRKDLIVARYTRENGIESIKLAVLKGAETTGTPVAPAYTVGNIYTSASVAEMPLYEITLSGVNITEVTPQFTLMDVQLSNVYKKNEVYTKGEVDSSVSSVSSALQKYEEQADRRYWTNDDVVLYASTNIVEVFNNNFLEPYKLMLEKTSGNFSEFTSETIKTGLTTVASSIKSSGLSSENKDILTQIVNILESLTVNIDSDYSNLYNYNEMAMTTNKDLKQ